MIIGSVRDGQDLMKSLMKLPLYFLSCKSVDIPLKGIRYYALRNSIFAQSVAIFMVYALSTFLAFYFGLVFPDYRTSLSQMSAVTNAFATVLLTFYVEPKISLAIDRDGEVVDNIMALLCGRLVGVGLLSHFFLMPLWMLV